MSTWTWMWVAWIVAFFAIEGAAIARKAKGDTLTEHFRRWFSLTGRSKWWWVRRSALGAGLLWLIFHFFFQGR